MVGRVLVASHVLNRFCDVHSQKIGVVLGCGACRRRSRSRSSTVAGPAGSGDGRPSSTPWSTWSRRATTRRPSRRSQRGPGSRWPRSSATSSASTTSRTRRRPASSSATPRCSRSTASASAHATPAPPGTWPPGRRCTRPSPRWPASSAPARSSNPALAATLGQMRRRLADQADRHFAPELTRSTPARRTDVVGSIATLTSFESWDALRHDLGTLRCRASSGPGRPASRALLPAVDRADRTGLVSGGGGPWRWRSSGARRCRRRSAAPWRPGPAARRGTRPCSRCRRAPARRRARPRWRPGPSRA